MKLRRNGYAWSDVRKLDNSIVHKVLVWLEWRRSPSLAAQDRVSWRTEAARKAFYGGLIDDPRPPT